MNAYKGHRELQDTQLYSGYYNNCFKGYDSSDITIQQFIKILKYIHSFFLKSPSKLNLLDIGCATGVFLDLARDFGVNAEGVEISKELRDYAVENFNFTVYPSIFSIEDRIQYYDLITLNDVIEHLPVDTMTLIFDKINEMLKENGILVIRTPLEDGILRRLSKLLYFGSLKYYESPMHLFYSYEHLINFSTIGMKEFFKKYNFSLIKFYREDENPNRLNINPFFKIILRISYMYSFITRTQHKGVFLFRKFSAN
jgi:SAM-dependent methyltransferase